MASSGGETYAARFGVDKGDIVQELGWDEDADEAISEAIEEAIGAQLLDEDSVELCDTILLWHREGDGDLVDSLVDAIRNLEEGGRIWLLTPGAGQPGGVNPGEISESAQLAGLVQTKADRFGEWQGSLLTAPAARK